MESVSGIEAHGSNGNCLATEHDVVSSMDPVAGEMGGRSKELPSDPPPIQMVTVGPEVIGSPLVAHYI